jgi:hypothetical protein
VKQTQSFPVAREPLVVGNHLRRDEGDALFSRRKGSVHLLGVYWTMYGQQSG